MSNTRGWKAMLVIVASMLVLDVARAQTPQPTTPPIITPPVIPIPTKDYYPPSNDNAIGSCDADSDGKSNPPGCAGRGNWVGGRGWREPSVWKEEGWVICSKDGGLDKHIDGNCLSDIAPGRLFIWAKCWSVREDKAGGEGGHAYYRLGRVHMVLSSDKKDIDEKCSPTRAPIIGPQAGAGSIVPRGCSEGGHSGVPICTVIGDPQDKPVSCPPGVADGLCEDNPQPPDQGSTQNRREQKK
jgi:hypothetical protein